MSIFHSGYYPGIFDQAGNDRENHLATSAGAQEKAHDKHEEEKGHAHDEHCEHDDEHDFLGAPKDFMDAFTRHFFVSEHTHLDEKGTNAPREILPWLKLAAELDPNKVESYTVGAYWLRQLQKNDEAEEFLREGFRHNPQSYEIAFELGRSYFDKKDFVRARNFGNSQCGAGASRRTRSRRTEEPFHGRANSAAPRAP
jgi:tetratricopeptide (TPR) repeat protein